MLHSKVLHLLTLFGSLTLILPPGWCCFLAAQEAAAAAPPCCQHHEPAEPSSDASDDHSPQIPVDKCPCDERDTTLLLNAAERAGFSFDLPAHDSMILMPVLRAGESTELLRRLPRPSARSLQVLHCSWLC